MTVVTMQQVESALKKTVGKKGMSGGEINKLAEYLMSFFGYTDEVIDNRLTSEDRDVFYMLEEAGLLTTTHEEVLLKKGKLWRIHYWILKKDQIIRLANADEAASKEVESVGDVYDQVSDEEWARHKSQPDQGPTEGQPKNDETN
ncbi:MAG: hypothetical protein A3K75_04530 [Euryarchaeota archaeon RBG_13_61_15]|jgi:hypothetical protein|nr:MAG: hypothetical protein A3K75_04530 [Euryarchaeota archaeon RBG_13_61_15]